MFKKIHWVFDALFLFLITALAFLPRLTQMGYFRDDWYFMLDGHISGAQAFVQMFSIDRPARGLFFEIYYSLLGLNPLAYHLHTYFWRLLATFAFMALHLTLWPGQRRAARFAALLLAVFPGYLFWVQGIEYLTHIVSLFFQIISIWMTLKAIQTQKWPARAAWSASAILTGWVYLALVEYAIGMEAFRLLAVFALVSRQADLRSLAQKARRALVLWLPGLLVPAGFLLWRTFFFQNERKATDVTVQLGYLLSDPVITLQWWLARFIQSFTNVSFFAWSVPFYQNFSNLPLPSMLIGFIITGTVILSVLLGHWFFSKLDGDAPPNAKWADEALWLGILGVAFGLVPIILANRYVIFRGFSHYGLPVSMAAVFLAVGLVNWLTSERVRLGVLTTLLAIGALTHYSIATNAARENEIIQKFWWQVSWRAPSIKPGTTLVVAYPSIDIGLDNDIIWGPANFLYFPEPTGEIPAKYNLAGVASSGETSQKILSDPVAFRDEYRSHYMNVDYANVLVLTQPSEGACVHVLDGQAPALSAQDGAATLLIASRSNVGNVLVDATPASPLKAAFGAEPPQTWCYFYEKTELALQQNQWVQALELADQVLAAGFAPQDSIEWMPFLEVYAHFGRSERVDKIAAKMAKVPFIRAQACQVLTKMDSLQPEISATRDTLLCR